MGIQEKSFYATGKKPGNAKKCKKCGRDHNACFDTAAAVRREFIKKFHKWMED